jgi:hypothetical protein
MRIYKYSSDPKTLIIRPKEGDPLVTPERLEQLRMGVVMLQHFFKHSCPGISTSVRGLSVADGAREAHFKALLRTFKYIIDT